MTKTIGVAQWMFDEIKAGKNLYQNEVVYTIQKKFGKDFIYQNDNGNLAIAKKVLGAFNKLTSTDVVWSKGEKMWRLRTPKDSPGRQQY